MRNKLTIDLRSSIAPAIQVLEQDKECLAYMIVTYFAGSFLYNALLTASDFATNEKLHQQIIDEFNNDYGLDDENFKAYVLECIDNTYVFDVIGELPKMHIDMDAIPEHLKHLVK